MIKKNFCILLITIACGFISISSVFSMVGSQEESYQEARLQLEDTLDNLLYNYSEGTYKSLNKALLDFENSIYFPVEVRANNEQKQIELFIEKIKNIRDLIKGTGEYSFNFDGFIRDYFDKHIIQKLDNRIDLALLDLSVSNGFGEIGGYPKTFKSDRELEEIIESLTGRIFQVSLVNGVVDIENSKIISTSSGTLISLKTQDNPKAFNILEIKDLEPNRDNPIILNALLTCAHALSLPNGLRANSYFVPSSEINLDNGFPSGLANMNVNGNGGLIQFLDLNPNSFFVKSFYIMNRANNSWKEVAAEMSQPQFEDSEDLVIGTIKHRNLWPLRYIGVNWRVQFNFDTENIQINRCFATGYPMVRHYELKKGLPPLVEDEGVAPLFITSSLEEVIIHNNGSLKHRSPCAQGMSGGAIFYFPEEKTMRILGVITSGEDGVENGCHWRLINQLL